MIYSLIGIFFNLLFIRNYLSHCKNKSLSGLRARTSLSESGYCEKLEVSIAFLN
jgi:hypothetical protein